MLSDMAKVSVNQPNSVLSGMTKKTEQKIAVESTLPEECKVVVKVSKCISGQFISFRLGIHGNLYSTNINYNLNHFYIMFLAIFETTTEEEIQRKQLHGSEY
jgi:hypothetical protein